MLPQARVLGTVPVTPWVKDSGLRVLGLPVCYPGTHDCARKLFGQVVDDLERACSVLHSLGDTQTEHLMLR